ncbi:MAG TPA: primosomal protein N', partial [Gammaproteobacteria bacterium]|nr:primosomal protein N' [Gammaproteobacteria bacterium]
IRPGMRVRVPFGKSRIRTGLVLEIADDSDLEPGRLKCIISIVDDSPVLSRSQLKLLAWASDYYQHPVGEVHFNGLPVPLRQGKPASGKKRQIWALTAAGLALDHAMLARAPRQRQLLEQLRQYEQGLDPERARLDNLDLRRLRALEQKGLAHRKEAEDQTVASTAPVTPLPLNPEQAEAASRIEKLCGAFHCILLNGVTGSGKTEVYLSLIRRHIDAGRQSLILVPEIGLTPQLMERIRVRLGSRVAILHSGLTDTERLNAWLEARDGRIPVILGTRSAVWTPLKNPGLIIVDEEHDDSYKQQDGFRYSARDVAIMRAKILGIPIVLGSATPSMESLCNAGNAKYVELHLRQRVAQVPHPEFRIVDMRSRPMQGALSDALLKAIGEELAARKQVLLFLNKRGYSPVLMCHGCGWSARCSRCDLPMTYYKSEGRIACHHCGSGKPTPVMCPECGANQLFQIGHGTERLTETLAEAFPRARILRIDRDSTRRRGALHDMISAINSGEVDILVGTQMLAKGHHFPNLDLVGIIDADRGLFSADFRASERMAQLVLQVSGRAGRVTGVGRVLLQTHHPDHPLLNELVGQGYKKFALSLLEERRAAKLPPYTHIALLQAEDYDPSRLKQFLAQARAGLEDIEAGLEVYGPYPAPLEKRAGRSRWQILVQSAGRKRLQGALSVWAPRLESIASGKKLRWFLDVDPREMI